MAQFLGIDLGTSSVKALVMADDGTILGWGSADYRIHHPRPAYAEQDPEDWWHATVIAVREAMGEIPVGQIAVSAIGMSGQMHGTVLLDSGQKLLCPAIIWPDQRSSEQVEEITQLVGAERLIEIAGSPVATGFQAATIRWLQQHQPQIWRETRMILTPKDYLRWRLTGGFQTDPSDGSGTLFLDVHRREWSSDLLKLLEIDSARLPPIRSSVDMAGDLQGQAARELGLANSIPVVVGAADTACSVLSAGVVNAESLLLTISTGGQLVLPAVDVNLDRKGCSHTFCSALNPTSEQAGWYQVAATLSAGLALRWLRDSVFGLGGSSAYDQMVSWAEQVPPGAHGLLFLPYLVGERSPHMDPHARGLFLGLAASHGQGDFVRAVMEGVALSCFDAFQVLVDSGANPRRIVLAGGGARSALWQQIVADIFGLPVQRLRVTEQSAVGAVLLAGGGFGSFDPALMALSWASYDQAVVPRESHRQLYEELILIYRDAYRKHVDDFRKLGELAS